MRRIVTFVLTLCFLVSTAAVALAHEAERPVMEASAYLLMDATTGEVLLEQAGQTRLPMASTTKIMTALLALERGNLTDMVTVGTKPYDTGGSTIYLEIGEKQTLENLLAALMLESANDAGVAIAEHLAGSEEKFAAWMNERAREIGAKQTHFVNSHGLHETDHYTTAYDLALIAREAMRNPTFRQLVTLEQKTIPGYEQNPPRELYNKNRLLGYYEGANGVKNGYTEEAGLTNVASARRGDTELIAVVLGMENRIWTASMALMDYGFSHYQTRLVVQKGEALGDVSVGDLHVPAVAGAGVAVTLPLEGAPEPRVSVQPLGDLKAPLAAGGKVGEVRVALGDREVAVADLVAAKAVEAPGRTAAGETAGKLSPWWLALVLGAAVAVWAGNRPKRA